MNKQQGKTPHKINVSEIFKKYQAQLKSFIAQRVTVKEDREDILQDVFYQLLKTDPVATPYNKYRHGFTQLPVISSLTEKENTGKKKYHKFKLRKGKFLY